jgi:dynein intermediate chain 2
VSPTLPLKSYVWDVNNPNEPTHTILPPSPITCLAFNPKGTETLAAGLYNGQVLFWDLRTDKPQASTPSETEKRKLTEAEKSHYDAVFDVVWPGSKTGAECISASPDGKVLWWDSRNLQGGPITTAVLTDGLPGDRVLGATRLDNSTEQPMKVLVGTEQGYVVQVMRKPGNKGEIASRLGVDGGKHHGPIFAIQRNPAQNVSSTS